MCLAQLPYDGQRRAGVLARRHADPTGVRLGRRAAVARATGRLRQRLLQQADVLREHHAPLFAVVHAAADQQRLTRTQTRRGGLERLGNTVMSTVPSMSSSVKKAMRFPLLVDVSLSPVGWPKRMTRAPWPLARDRQRW